MDKVVRFCKTDPNEIILQNARETHLAYMHKKIAIALAEEINEKYCDAGESGQLDTIVRRGGVDVDGLGWRRCKDELPLETGRYWCYVESITDLGKSHYQWNYPFTEGEGWHTENGDQVTHWRELPEPPEH